MYLVVDVLGVVGLEHFAGTVGLRRVNATRVGHRLVLLEVVVVRPVHV